MFVNKDNASKCNEQAIDLLERMLCYDKNDRITAREAIDHPYFDSIRSQFKVVYKE